MVPPSGEDVKMIPPSHPRTLQSRNTGSTWSGQWRKARIALLVLSTFLIIALFAMHVLEIARLSSDHQGIGLLPFCFIPLVIVLASLYLPSPAWSRGGWSRPARPHGLAWIFLVSF